MATNKLKLIKGDITLLTVDAIVNATNGYSKMSFNDPDGHEANPRDIEIGKDLNED